MLELAKAYAVSQEALIHKITEYQQAAKELRLDRNGTYCIIEAFHKSRRRKPDCLPELLTHISSQYLKNIIHGLNEQYSGLIHGFTTQTTLPSKLLIQSKQLNKHSACCIILYFIQLLET